MRYIKTGILSGLIYGILFLLIEDIVGLSVIGNDFTTKQIFFTLLSYSLLFVFFGCMAGIFNFIFSGKKRREFLPLSGSLALSIAGAGVFYFGYQYLAKLVLPKEMKILALGLIVWGIIVFLIIIFLKNIIRKYSDDSRPVRNLKLWAMTISITIFLIPIFKIQSSPAVANEFTAYAPWWILTLLALSTGIYLLLAKRGAGGKVVGTILSIIGVSVLIIISLNAGTRLNLPDKASTGGNKPNIVILMLDALRADHLDLYGYQRQTSENITRIAKNGVVFERVLAPASWTKPSIGSLFTSVYPGIHKADGWAETLPLSLQTLAEILQDNGYFTAGISTNPFITEDYNFAQGFDTFAYLLGKGPKQLFIPTDPVSSFMPTAIEFAQFAQSFDSESAYASARSVNQKALKWLDNVGGKPFFLYLHYMEPHQPYLPPKLHFSRGKLFSLRDYKLMKLTHNPRVKVRIDERFRDYVASRYDDEIYFLDKELGKVFDKLTERGLWDNTVVIICSDHGEELLERGAGGHGHTLYQEQLRVPLIVLFPEGKYSGEVIPQWVSLMDIMPTLFDYLQIENEDRGDGISLMPLLDGGTAFAEQYDRIYYGEVHPFKEGWHDNIYAIIRNEDKLIYSLDDSGEEWLEIYNLASDSQEKVNLIDPKPELFDDLNRILEKYKSICDSISLTIEIPDTAEISAEQKARLRALGYIK